MNAPDPHAPQARLTPVQLGVLALLALAAMSAYLTRHCIAVANTTIQRELSLSSEQMGWVLGAFSVGYFVFQIPGGWLGNKIGTRAAYALISGLWSLLTVWTSVATSWLTLAVSRAAFGCAQAGMVPLSAKIINDWFPVSRRGICSATVASSMSVGGVLAMGVTGLLLAHLHWRDVFRLYSLVGIGWSLGFYAYFRTRPDEHPWLRSHDVGDHAAGIRFEEDSDRIPAQAADTDSRAAGLTTTELFRRVVGSRTIWAINLQSFFRAAAYALFVTWFPAFLEYRYKLPAAEAGTLTMYPLIGVIVGILLGGAAVDRVLTASGSKWLSRSGMAAGSLAVCTLLIYGASWSESSTRLVLWMSLGSFCSGFSHPSSWAATMDVAGKQTAVIVGAMNMAGTIGAFAMPVVMGYVIGDIRASGGDWNVVIYVMAGVYLAAALTWLAVDPNHPVDVD